MGGGYVSLALADLCQEPKRKCEAKLANFKECLQKADM